MLKCLFLFINLHLILQITVITVFSLNRNCQMKIVILFSIFLTCFAPTAFSQNYTIDQYVQTYREMAIREMRRMGVPAAITLAQGLLETENGNSDLVKKSNNHFGIKCKSSWNAGSVTHDDDAQGECFRTYKDAEASYRDHSNYLRGNERYAFLFKLDPRDYKAWARGLKNAGYATNPRYPDILIKNIEDHDLQQYTLVAVKDVPVYDASLYKADPEEKAIEKITGNDHLGEPDSDVKILINGIKAVQAHKGRSLLAIATENNINLIRLLEFNDLQQEGLLQKDQYIFLERKSKEGDKPYYITQTGESLYDVSQKTGVRLQNLTEFNNLASYQILTLGQRIFLRQGRETSLAVHENVVQAPYVPVKLPEGKVEKKIHLVQPSEGLYGLSKKYGVTIAQLKEWNNLNSDILHIGQVLIISK